MIVVVTVQTVLIWSGEEFPSVRSKTVFIENVVIQIFTCELFSLSSQFPPPTHLNNTLHPYFTFPRIYAVEKGLYKGIFKEKRRRGYIQRERVIPGDIQGEGVIQEKGYTSKHHNLTCINLAMYIG